MSTIFFKCCNNSVQTEEPVKTEQSADLKQPKITWENTIPFMPPITNGIVIKVCDGYIVTIATQLLSLINDSAFYRFSIILNGLTCPDINSSDDDEKVVATIGRQLLRHILINQHVTLENVSFEKYGRILADVYCNDKNINEYLIKRKLAIKYSKTKPCIVNWYEYHVNLKNTSPKSSKTNV